MSSLLLLKCLNGGLEFDVILDAMLQLLLIERISFSVDKFCGLSYVFLLHQFGLSDEGFRYSQMILNTASS